MPIPLVLPTVPSLGVITEDSANETVQARRIGRYTLGRRLGAGCSSSVFSAHEAPSLPPVAIKVLEANASDKASLARFQREAELLCELSPHAALVTGIEWGEERRGLRCHYLVMGLAHGRTLQTMLLEKPRLEWDLATGAPPQEEAANGTSRAAAKGLTTARRAWGAVLRAAPRARPT